MMKKERLTVTVDRELVAAGNAAVAEGRAESLSGWVNQALAERVTKERRLRAMAEAVQAYESQHGEISADELAAQRRADRSDAVVVRDRRASAKPKRKTRRRSAA